MTSAPNTYDEWLALSDEDRRIVHFKVWDVYERDGIAIAYTAATRLAMESSRKVLSIEIGTYHGGEYLLHMEVSAEEYADCPPMLEDVFEGFRVVWLPASEFHIDKSGSSLEGSWISEDGDYEFDFTKTASGLDVSGRIKGTNADLVILHPTLNEEYVIFSSFEPEHKITMRHGFQLVDTDLAQNELTYPCKFHRKSKIKRENKIE
jgi:hypothetical protein